MKVKKWNGSAWVQDYPEVNVSSIVATGTPSGSTFLRGDGAWATITATDSTKLPLAGGTMNLSGGTTSVGIYFNTAQTFIGPQIRGKVQELFRDYYTASYKIWDEGNDGAGSGLDADLLDGNQQDTNSTANTIVRRDSSAYIRASYYNSSRGDETSAAASYIYDTGDGWIRKKTLANARSEIVTSGAVTDALGYTPYNSTNPSGYITSSNSITGTSAGVVRTVTGTNSAELVRGNMADNDQARILVGGTGSNAGYLEIATADDGTEPIHVRQYTGVFTSLTRTATLLDGSGNTSFPGTVTAPTFSGGLSGNATTATTWQTARTLTIGNTGKSVNGSGNVSWSLAEIGAYAATNPSGYTSYSANQAVNTTSNVTFNNLSITGADNLFNKNNPAISNTSYVVGNNNIELRTTNGSNVILGFHRSGFTAVALYHDANNSLRLRDANTGTDSLMWHSSNLTNLNQLTNGPGYLTSTTAQSGGFLTSSSGLNASNLTSGTVPAARIPNAGTTTVGGVKVRLSGSTLFITSNGNNP